MQPHVSAVPDSMKNIPETKARMVRCGRMCPMLLMTKAVKTKSRDTMGKGVAVRTISLRRQRERGPMRFRRKVFQQLQIKHFTPFKEFLLLCCEGNTS